jgi:hypothetical protein
VTDLKTIGRKGKNKHPSGWKASAITLLYMNCSAVYRLLLDENKIGGIYDYIYVAGSKELRWNFCQGKIQSRNEQHTEDRLSKHY